MWRFLPAYVFFYDLVIWLFRRASVCRIEHRSRDLSVHITPDRERPESWTWSPTVTFRHEIGDEGLNTPADIRRAWDHFAENHAEPFRSALLSLPGDEELWCERLAQWPTVKWDRSGRGSVTLAGDAAHPMTYRELGSFLSFILLMFLLLLPFTFFFFSSRFIRSRGTPE